MKTITTNLPVSEAQTSIVIIRANGTREDLGVVSYYNCNLIKQWSWTIRNWIKIHFGD
jgi:hypothetical protein